MRKYKINRTNKEQTPTSESIAKRKNFRKLWHEYDRYTKRPTKPIYKDKKLFFFLLMIALMALILSQVSREKGEKDDAEIDKDTMEILIKPQE